MAVHPEKVARAELGRRDAPSGADAGASGAGRLGATERTTGLNPSPSRAPTESDQRAILGLVLHLELDLRDSVSSGSFAHALRVTTLNALAHPDMYFTAPHS